MDTPRAGFFVDKLRQGTAEVAQARVFLVLTEELHSAHFLEKVLNGVLDLAIGH